MDIQIPLADNATKYTYPTQSRPFLTMKFLLCQNLVYLPTHGGANKSNRMLLEALVAAGHECLAITPATGVQGPASVSDMANQVASFGFEVVGDVDHISYTAKGVNVRAMTNTRKLRAEFERHIHSFSPDWIIVSTEDTMYALLSAAVDIAPDRVIYLARTTLLLPFGPDSALPDDFSTQRLAKVSHIFCVSEFIQTYILKYACLRSAVVPLSFYGEGPFADLSNFDSGFVTMVNPCAVKGISIFLALADAMPDVAFAAVITWGTTSADQAQMDDISNITILKGADDIDEIFRKTRILLVPSLWAEGKGEVVIEAMLRGIPVIAADVGGLREAKLGVDYLIKVVSVREYLREYDERMIPVPVIPQQQIQPWIEALRILALRRSVYAKISSESRKAAIAYAANATVQPFLDTLIGVRQAV